MTLRDVSILRALTEILVLGSLILTVCVPLLQIHASDQVAAKWDPVLPCGFKVEAHVPCTWSQKNQVPISLGSHTY